ncbi:MAG: cyclic nucleotide-binding domain-containing protein [Acidimicrobiales bacterium]|nr:cyclic nucleotide-binding domain-containing protein [Acidimicrobiales bacterium]MCB9373498.1 cyclic nucleotide-binding domain-containing protein [Microthrixaceae bacterium]
MNAVAAVVVGVDLPLLGVGPTPLRMLLTLVVLTALVLLVLWLLTLVAGRPIDKKWPPDEPLDPTEMLWGEVGGFVQKSFAGLDLNLAQDLASYMEEQKVSADTWIVQYGDPASHYYVLKKGEAELFGGTGGPTGPLATATGRRLAEGEGFGDHAITHRLLSDIGVRAVTDCVILKLPAQDYIAALTVSAASGDTPLLGQGPPPVPAAAGAPPTPPPPAGPPPSGPPPGATSF